MSTSAETCVSTWQDLLDEKINWLLWDLGSDMKRPALGVVATGTGGFAEMKAQIGDAALVFGAFRVRAIDIKRGVQSVRPRVVGFMFAGPETKTIARARFSGQKSKAMGLMVGVAATFELVGTPIAQFTMRQVATELIGCCGAHQPTQYDFCDGGVFYISGGPDGVQEVAPKPVAPGKIRSSRPAAAPEPKKEEPKKKPEPKKEAAPAPAPAATATSTGAAGDPAKDKNAANRCAVCGKMAYMQERVSLEGVILHKKCFRCDHCGKTLSPTNFAALNHKYYCKPHFKQLFAQQGNYKFAGEEAKPRTEQPKPAPQPQPQPQPQEERRRELPKPKPKAKPAEEPKKTGATEKKAEEVKAQIAAYDKEIDQMEEERLQMMDRLKDLEKKIEAKEVAKDKLKEQLKELEQQAKDEAAEEEMRRKEQELQAEKERLEAEAAEEEERERLRREAEEEEEMKKKEEAIRLEKERLEREAAEEEEMRKKEEEIRLEKERLEKEATEEEERERLR